MKKITLNIVVAAALFIISSIDIAAQNPQLVINGRTRPSYDITVAGDVETGSIDSACTDAILPFRVTPDSYFSSRPGIYNPSGFGWTWTGTALNNSSGGALTAIEPGFYEDTVVRATMPATTGNQTLAVNEKSYPKSGNGCEDATGVTLTVEVIDKPTMELNAAQDDTVGDCSATDYAFDMDFTGVYPFYVDYEIEAFDASDASLGSTNYQAEIRSGEEFMVDDGDQLSVGSAVKYVITINDVWDRISYRSINQSAVAVTPTADEMVVYVYPTPTTNDIKHLINNK